MSMDAMMRRGGWGKRLGCRELGGGERKDYCGCRVEVLHSRVGMGEDAEGEDACGVGCWRKAAAE